MCEQCETECLIWRQVVPGWFLIHAQKDGDVMKRGQFGLGRMNGPDFIFDQPPEVEPPCSDVDDYKKEWKTWSACARIFHDGLRSDPVTGWALVNACEKAGYGVEKDGSRVGFWLFDHLGKHMKATKGVFHGADDDERERQQGVQNQAIRQDPQGA